MKKALSILLCLALALTLGAGALASGEPSGDASDVTVMSMNASAEAGVTAYAISADGMEATATDSVNVASGEITDAYADGVVMDITDFSTNGFVVSGGEYTISNANITKAPSGPVDANATGGVIAKVTDGTLIIKDSTFTNAGKGGRNGNYTVDCERTGVMVVINSDIIQTGFTGDPDGFTADIADPPSNLALGISGYARANMSVGRSQTYYYGSYVETEGWAAMSTDSAQSGFAFYSYDSVGKALHGGYGTYADTSCVDWFYASDLISAEVGAIISNNGEIHMRNGAAADEAALAYLPADYQVTERYGEGRSSVQAGRNDFQLHSPDMGGGGARGDFVAILDLEDTDLVTSAELDKDATLIDWSKDYGPAIAEYVDLVKGANILVKSTGADIDLKNVTAESSSGVLLLTALNSDSMSRYALAADDMSEKFVTMTVTDSAVSGDVQHYDYQRNTAVELVNSTWDGAYVTIDKAAWDAMWSDTAKADAYCYWILDTAKYFDGAGTVSTMSVDASSVWNVTGASNLDKLTVAAGGVVNGSVMVDGAPVDVSKGGSWEGDIVIAPAAGSGEAGIAPGTYSDGVNNLVIADDLTFVMETVGANMEGAAFSLTVTGAVENGEFVIQGLFDGDLDLIDLATEDQIAENYAALRSAYGAGGGAAAPAGGGIVPGVYGALTVNDDLTFQLTKTGQNLEGAEFTLYVSGHVEGDEFVIDSLSDGSVELIEMATDDQKAADLASVYEAYNG